MAFAAPLAAMGLPSLLSAGLTVAGTGLAMFSSIQQGNYQAKVARNNAQIAEYNAAVESQRAQTAGLRSDREHAAVVAEAYAQQAASGFDILGRSQTATRNTTRRAGRESAMDIRLEGVGTARRLLQDAANFRGEAKQARRQGIMNAIGAGLQGLQSLSGDLGFTSSLATSRSGGRRPWDMNPDWYKKG